jgi:hypothetical protein
MRVNDTKDRIGIDVGAVQVHDQGLMRRSASQLRCTTPALVPPTSRS